MYCFKMLKDTFNLFNVLILGWVYLAHFKPSVCVILKKISMLGLKYNLIKAHLN